MTVITVPGSSSNRLWITGGEVRADELKSSTGQRVAVTGPGYAAVVNPAAGGGISSLKLYAGSSKGTEVVCDGSTICGIGLWMPTRGNFTKACRIMKIEPMRNGVQMTLERQDQDTNLKFQIVYFFSEKGIRQTLTVTNVGKSSQPLACRVHNHTYFAEKGDKVSWDGTSVMIQPGQKMLTMKGAKAEVKAFESSLLQLKREALLQGNAFTLRKAGSPVELTFHALTPLYGIYFWTPEKGTGTFEPSFLPSKENMNPGENRSFSYEWTWRIAK